MTTKFLGSRKPARLAHVIDAIIKSGNPQVVKRSDRRDLFNAAEPRAIRIATSTKDEKLKEGEMLVWRIR